MENVFEALKSGVGKKVRIIFGTFTPGSSFPDFSHPQEVEGILTSFDEEMYEAEIGDGLRIGTQVIRSVAFP